MPIVLKKKKQQLKTVFLYTLFDQDNLEIIIYLLLSRSRFLLLLSRLLSLSRELLLDLERDLLKQIGIILEPF